MAQLPKRVAPGVGDRTVGVGKFDDRPPLPPMESGNDPVWTPRVERRLRDLGVRPDRLKGHVELRFAEMMIDTGQQHAHLAINYTPCGVETRKQAPDACAKVLPDYLPAGYTLTVHGTRQNNEPFTETYEGRA